eukprot:4344836-Prymnesium_polylepis.1
MGRRRVPSPKDALLLPNRGTTTTAGVCWQQGLGQSGRIDLGSQRESPIHPEDAAAAKHSVDAEVGGYRECGQEHCRLIRYLDGVRGRFLRAIAMLRTVT